MKIISLIFLLVTCALFSCGEEDKSFDYKLHGGFKVTVQVPMSTFMEKLTNEFNHEGLKHALENIEEELSPEQYFSSLFDIAENGDYPFNLKELLVTGNRGLFYDAVQVNTNEAFIEVLLHEYNQAIDKTVNILEARLINYQVTSINAYRNNYAVIIEVPGKGELSRIRQIIQSTVEIGFYTPYESNQVYSWFNNAKKYSSVQEDSLMNPNQNVKQYRFDLFDYLMMDNMLQNYQSYAEIGHAKEEDTARISQYINKIRGTYTPLTCKFVWSYSKIEHLEGNSFSLYCLETPPKFKGDVITKAIQEINSNGSPCLTMYFNPEGTKDWEEYTEERVGKSIAIVINNSVYSAPVVNEKIPGGVTQVSGNMEVLETKEMANILSAGNLPYFIYISDEEVTGPSL